MDLMFWAFLISFVTGLYLTGLIWLVQKVHYPTFHFIDPNRVNEFAVFHQKTITWVVAPIMILEFIATLSLHLLSPTRIFSWFLLILLTAIWGSTFFLSVPLHKKLLDSADPKLVNELIFTNWPRTLLWTVKSTLMIYFFNTYL